MLDANNNDCGDKKFLEQLKTGSGNRFGFYVIAFV